MDELTRLKAELEREAGGEILNQAMVRIQPGSTDSRIKPNLYGLLVLTETAVFFKHYAQANWFTGMVNSTRGRTTQEEEFSLLIPREEILELNRSAETSFWKRLFRAPEPLYLIRYRDPSNIEQQINISIVFCEQGEPQFYKTLSES